MRWAATLADGWLPGPTAKLEKLLSARLEAIERAQRQFEESITRVPTEVQKAVMALEERTRERFTTIHAIIDGNQALTGERFRSVDSQFSQRDVAVTAALSAAKEAVTEQNRASATAISKSESATNERLNQLGLLMQTTGKASDDKVTDIKDRLTLIEGKTSGIDINRSNANRSSSLAIAVVAVIASIVGTAVIIVTRPPAPAPIVIDRTVAAPTAPAAP